MKVAESFVIDPHARARLGRSSRTSSRVARCVPGVEDVTMDDPDNGTVRITQSLGR